jgi:thioredoxin-related protein
MKKTIAIVLVSFLMLAITSMAPRPVVQEEAGEVRWMTFEEAVERSKTEKRKIFIDVYTDWCGWCKVMDKKTFNEPAVAKLLNEKYYPVKFNAEQREDVLYKGTIFKFIEYGGRGTHQLAAALLNNQLSYPSVVFLNEKLEIVHVLKGYQQAPAFHKIAEFIGGDHYKSTKMDAWEPQYQSPF